MEDDRPLSAKERRQEQIKRWENSATDLECATYTNPKVRVKFDDGAVFLAACSAGDLNEVKALLDGGADINFANVDGLTALHQACIDGNLEVVEFLVEHGSEMDQEDNEGWTPLHATASCGFMDIAKYLVKKGANVGAVNSEAELPIDTAEEDDMRDYLQSEVDNQGIDVEAARDIERRVMLEDANDLLDKYQNGEKYELYRHQKSGATPMHITAAKGYNDVLKILIKAGLDVNARDNDGWTPLHAASHWSQEESAKILADRNADFKARSKLGQTPFDVADEDMLEYLEDLEREQKDNVKDLVIEPPPSKVKKTSPTKDSSEILKINEIPNGEKRTSRKAVTESSESSSEEEETPAPTRVTALPPRPTPSDTKREKDKTPLTNDHITEDPSDRLARRTRPASLHITTEQPQHRPLAMTNSEGGSKPIAATQPVQAVGRSNRENGGRTPTFTRDTKEEAPSSWRTGLRKTGSFDDKSKLNSLNSKSEIEKSSSYSARFAEDKSDRTARVAPILDARKTKNETETDDTANEVLSGTQKSTSFTRRKPGFDNIPTITTTDTTTDTTSSFKRSSVSESPNETSATANDAAGAAKAEDAERRRSHLQPVRDEEAEAQRRIRSRRERQTRRSTQGVTLDVVEEAMRTIGQMKQKQPSADKSGGTDSLTDSKSRNDSSTSLHKRSDDSQPAPSASGQSSLFSSTSASAGTPISSLPSGYIPSDQRVKANEQPEPKTTTLAVPGISVDPDDDEDIGDTSTTSNESASSTAAQRKSAAQQRRRNRKERRSTGLPDLKPSASATENNNDAEEEDNSPKEDSVDAGKAERLRAKYDSSSLPNRHERHRGVGGVRSSDSDIPSRLNQSQPTIDDSSSYSTRSRVTDTQNYKKLYEENQSENERLRNELADAQRKISELEARLEKAEENSTRKQALDNEKRERRTLERKLADMEQELQKSEKAEDLRNANEHLKAENNALQRIVEKLGGTMPEVATRAVEDTPDSYTDSTSSKASKKADSAPDLRKLEVAASKPIEKEPKITDSSARISRSSSSSSLSLEDEPADVRRGSYAGSYSSQPNSDVTPSRYVSSRHKDSTDSTSSVYSSTGSYTSSLRSKARLEASVSSPSLLARSSSPRRTPAASSYQSTDYGRSSSFTPSRYTSSRKDSAGYTGTSSSGYNTIPGSGSTSRRDYLKSFPSSSGSLSSHRTGTSSYRSSPSPYMSSPSKSSYSSSSSRPRHGGYSSTTTGRTGTSSTSKLSTPLSKYPTGLSSSSSSRRLMKY